MRHRRGFGRLTRALARSFRPIALAAFLSAAPDPRRRNACSHHPGALLGGRILCRFWAAPSSSLRFALLLGARAS